MNFQIFNYHDFSALFETIKLELKSGVSDHEAVGWNLVDFFFLNKTIQTVFQSMYIRFFFCVCVISLERRVSGG